MFQSEKGQATVELALVLVFLFLIIFAIIDFGRIFYSYLDVSHTSREAARVASLGGTDMEIRDRAIQTSNLGTKIRLTIQISPNLSLRKRGTYVTVQVAYSVDLSTPLLSNILPNPIQLNNKTVMRVE